MTAQSHYDLLVGTFDTPSIFTLRFVPPSRSTSSIGTLKILKEHSAIGSHSWLHLNPPSASNPNATLYATAWTEPSTLASYRINSPIDIKLLNTAPTKTRSGYVCASSSHAYSAGGASGEVYAIDRETGRFTSSSSTTINGHSSNGTEGINIQPAQRLTFVDAEAQRDDGSTMDFGGLRHGAHSADLSPDGSLIYIADIGRNCIWVYSVSQQAQQHLTLQEKKISPRSQDGPRHVHPHPNGKVVYCLQEHTSMVDVFEVVQDGEKVRLVHKQGVRIIPQGLHVGDFWADEVRTSLGGGSSPKYLYASTRGLKEGKKGYVAVYELGADGYIKYAEMVKEVANAEPRADDQDGLLDIFETATSGGWANAIQPGPTVNGVEYIAMTDSEIGLVFVLSWDGAKMEEVARVNLNDAGAGEGRTHGAATAVWL